MSTGPIALFDSGVGGLSVLRHVRRQLPGESLIYLADQAHVPYGARAASEIRAFSRAVTRFFLGQGAKLVVVACNTASAAALDDLRRCFPELPFVGMEPAVKPAALHTKSGKVGVLATEGTFGSERYASLMHRFAAHVEVFEDPCPGLVATIETGALSEPATEALLQQALDPMLAAGVDTLVLGCTHYPFIEPLIQKIAIEQLSHPLTIIDPAPAVATQTVRVLHRHSLATADPAAAVRLYTSGAPEPFAALATRLLEHAYPVQQVVWHRGKLIAA